MKTTQTVVTLLNAVTLGTKICRKLDGAHMASSHTDIAMNQEALERMLTSKIISRIQARKEKANA